MYPTQTAINIGIANAHWYHTHLSSIYSQFVRVRATTSNYLDLKAKRIFRPGRATKNGRLRYLPVYGDMAADLEVAIATADRRCPFLIQRNGERVFDFKKAWATACAAAGVKEALFHDLRRTALTNMIEAGLSEKEAMEISGHRTRAVFDRYYIVSDRRMKQNAKKLGEHLKAKENLSNEAASGKTNRRLN